MIPSAAPIRLLLVDDDPLTCELLTALLQRERFEVHAADSEAAATALFEKALGTPGAFDAVLTDLQMPGEGGVGLARKVRLRSRSVTLAGMSARAATPEEEAAFDVFFRKPFPVEELRFALEAIAQVARTRPESAVAGETAVPAYLADLSASAAGSESGSARDPSPSVLAAAPTAPARLDPAVLDLRITAQLRSALGDAQWKQLLEITVLDVEKRFQTMRSSLASGHAERVRTEAHVIRGSSGMVGAVALSRVAAHLEESSELDTLLLNELEKACEGLRRMVTIVPP